MKRWLLLTAMLALGLGRLSAQENPPASAAKQTAGARKEYEALVKEYEAAREQFMKAYSKAKTDAEREKLAYPSPEKFSGRFIALAREQAENAAALDALTWVATNCRQGSDLETSLELLGRNHIQTTNLAAVARALIYSDNAKAEEWLRVVMKETPHHEVKGWATYGLGRVVMSRARSATTPADNQSEAEKLFENVAANYPDVQWYRGSLAEAAKGELFEMRNLAIGKVAPDIEGEDAQGHKFKLSEYRGKVVVIDFWGDW